MRWNCPHCSETVSIAIDLEQMKRAYVRCGACKGIALLQTKTAYADHEAAKLAAIQMRERQLEIQAAQLQQAHLEQQRQTRIASETARAQALATRSQIMPPPFHTPNLQSAAMDIAREIDLEIEETVRTLAAMDRNGGNRRILRAGSFSGEVIDDHYSETPEEVVIQGTHSMANSPEDGGEAQITVTELGARVAEILDEPVVATPSSAAAMTDTAGAIANFDRSNPAMQIPARSNSPMPPAFLMGKQRLVPMPIQFATNEVNPSAEPRTAENQKLLKFAVIVATIVAIVSGLYLFTQGQKLMQSAAVSNSNSSN